MATTGSRMGPPVAEHPTAALVAAILSCLAVGQAARNPASAQEDSTRRSDSGVVVGVVTSREMYEPLSGAQVVVVGTALATTTDSLGQFTLRGAPAGPFTIQIRAVGYTPQSWHLSAPPGPEAPRSFELDALPYQLPRVLVKEKTPLAARRFADFERRHHSGMGYFITQEQIERSGAATLVDLLARVRGVEQVCLSNDCVAKMVRSPPGCYPQYFLDGMESRPYFARHTPPGDIRGIEIYRGSSEIPGEFTGSNSACGVIAIWTKSSP